MTDCRSGFGAGLTDSSIGYGNDPRNAAVAGIRGGHQGLAIRPDHLDITEFEAVRFHTITSFRQRLDCSGRQGPADAHRDQIRGMQLMVKPGCCNRLGGGHTEIDNIDYRLKNRRKNG